MFYEVKTINGAKTKVPLTNSSGVVAGGNPIGTIISTYKKIKPANYLYCDGSTFDPEIYPGLYLYLGTNTLPDYRECAMVGAEKNTTNVFDSSETDPSTGLPGTQSHDVYTEGEFKDDQFQGHFHGEDKTAFWSGSSTSGSGEGAQLWSSITGAATNIVSTAKIKIQNNGENGTPRIGSTTHGKQKAVFYYIKAVDGVDITDEDAFLEEVKDFVEAGQSYSTTEQRTGGTWIDGKPIYRLVSVADRTLEGSNTQVAGVFSQAIADTVDTIIRFTVVGGRDAYPGQPSSAPMVTNFNAWQSTADNKNMYCNADNKIYSTSIIVEYTKTTD